MNRFKVTPVVSQTSSKTGALVVVATDSLVLDLMVRKAAGFADVLKADAVAANSSRMVQREESIIVGQVCF
jgi:hypothetical protein